MPTYQYKCQDCGIVFERFQHFSEEPVRACPECKGEVRRVIQPVGIIFKGSGFYVTDHKGSTSPLMPKADKDGKLSDLSAATETAAAASEAAKSATPAPAAESKPAQAEKPASR